MNTVEPEDITLENDAESGLLEELLEYLQAISNPSRLEILMLIEKGPRSVREISDQINLSYDNTKKHIEKLLGAGIIRKEPGIGKETSRGALPVWKYSLMPGGIESVIRNLNSFSNLDLKIVNDKVSETVNLLNKRISRSGGMKPYLQVLGGDDDNKLFFLISPLTRIGRETRGHMTEETEGFIALSGSYYSVTRITGTHAEIYKDGANFFFCDPGSTNGSSINHRPVMKGDRIHLSDGDIIDLGRGQTRARLIFHINC